MRQCLSRTNAHVRGHTRATKRIEIARPLVNGSGRDRMSRRHLAHETCVDSCCAAWCYNAQYTLATRSTASPACTEQIESLKFMNINDDRFCQFLVSVSNVRQQRYIHVLILWPAHNPLASNMISIICDVSLQQPRHYYAPPLIDGGIKRCFCLTSV